MKPFHCDSCGGLVFFENNACVKCGHALGFLPELLDLSAVETEGDALRPLAPAAKGRLHRRCANGRQHDICNWLVAVDDPEPFCVACRLNDMVPDLSVTGNRDRWYRLECAKRRLIYTLLKLRLPLDAVATEGRPALRFRFLGDIGTATPVVLTGHESGVITLNIAEADDDVREARRVSLHEPLRTLLGHFRHEIAHYYWDRLIADSQWLDRFRTLFGDEREDYAEALKRHYEKGPSADWLERSVTAYASAHPWEDWAETWAHYLHIIDTIETAAGFGLTLKPRHPSADSMTADPKIAAKEQAGFDLILSTWFPLTYALNSLNRGMGLSDLYPFVLSATAIDKLRFIHEVVEGSRLPGN